MIGLGRGAGNDPRERSSQAAAAPAGHAYARLGRTGDAEATLDGLLARFPGRWVPGVDVAAILAGLGRHDEALDWLERAHGLRSFDVVFAAADPRFADIGHHSRLLSLVAPRPATTR